jgi:phosphatidylserine/phosphatidylglycerophosphate/cardiolipin synthase-like enzyme
MAKILTTKGSAASLEDIIRKAEKELYLISFSFIISDAFMTCIRQATDRGVTIHVVYGKSIKPENLKQLLEMKGVKIYRLDNLHAKIYSNEVKCIVGSMNLSEFSENNNTELGVHLSIQVDKNAFEEVVRHCIEIVTRATLEKPQPSKSNTKGVEKRNVVQVNTSSNELHLGYCIRTGRRIPLNHEKPLSEEAFESWAVWEDDEYPEKFDHFTGEKSDGETCYARPILGKNWKKYQKMVQG